MNTEPLPEETSSVDAQALELDQNMSAASKLTTKRQTELGSYACPKCGHQVFSGDKFCTRCGWRQQL